MANRAPERIGILLSPGLPGARLAWAGPGTLLHLLGEALCPFAQGIERPALRLNRIIRVALAERPFGFAHRIAGAAEGIALALTLTLTLLALLPLALLARLRELTVFSQFLDHFLQLFAQGLLVLFQIAHFTGLAGFPGAVLARLAALLVAMHFLTLPEGAIAQLLLLSDHVTELIERGRHLVIVIAVLRARPRHLEILEH